MFGKYSLRLIEFNGEFLVRITHKISYKYKSDDEENPSKQQRVSAQIEKVDWVMIRLLTDVREEWSEGN